MGVNIYVVSKDIYARMSYCFAFGNDEEISIRLRKAYSSFKAL
jgi:hypothetical protein